MKYLITSSPQFPCKDDILYETDNKQDALAYAENNTFYTKNPHYIWSNGQIIEWFHIGNIYDFSR
jgi:hypothetical protein